MMKILRTPLKNGLKSSVKSYYSRIANHPQMTSIASPQIVCSMNLLTAPRNMILYLEIHFVILSGDAIMLFFITNFSKYRQNKLIFKLPVDSEVVYVSYAHFTVSYTNRKVGDCFAKQMNLQEIFYIQTLYT